MVDAAEKRSNGQTKLVTAERQLVATQNDVNRSFALLRRGMGFAKSGSSADRKQIALALSASLGKIVRSPWSAKSTSRQVFQSFLKAAHVSPHNGQSCRDTRSFWVRCDGAQHRRIEG